MKKHLPLLAAFALTCSPAAAQEGFIPLEKWDNTTFCSYTDLHPMQAVRADNNWQVLRALRGGGTSRELFERGIPCTRSQLLLLETLHLLVRTDEGTLQTAVPMLDSLATSRLRHAAAATAAAMYGGLEPELRAFADELAREGFGENTFSILFSYVLDGTIWDEFERREIVRYDEDAAAGWSGCLWFSYPRSEAFRPGTNSLSWDGRHALHVNWADGDPAFARRIYRDDVQRFFRQTLANETPDDAAVRAARELGLLEGTRMTVPVIRNSGPLARRTSRLTGALCEEFLRRTDVQRVRELTGCEPTDALLIYYHEVMWQLSERLLAGGIVRLPRLFADPAHAAPGDLAAVCFITSE